MCIRDREEGHSFFNNAERGLPGTPGTDGGIDEEDPEPGLPINDYIPYLLAAGLMVAFANRKKLAKLNK